jgi:cell division protein FtsI/penicillin-binding protein 2
LSILFLLSSLLGAQTAEVVFHLESGAVVYRRDDAKFLDRPFPAGSVLKLFVAYLSLEKGLPPDRVVFCPPTSPSLPVRLGCWFRQGHRNQDLVQAIANSCDRYFLTVAERVPLSRLTDFLKFLEVDPVRVEIPEGEYGEGETLVGLDPGWRFDLVRLFAAVGALTTGRLLSEPGPAGDFRMVRRIALRSDLLTFIRQGMRESTLYGTSAPFQSGLGCKTMGKTGTFVSVYPQTDRKKLNGLFFGFFPYPEPEYGVLVLGVNGNGSDQAARANRLVKKLIGEKKISLARGISGGHPVSNGIGRNPDYVRRRSSEVARTHSGS